MKIFFVICFIILLASLLLKKRDNQKKSIILWSVIYIVLIFIINSLIIFGFSLVKIPVNLFGRGIIFLIISLPILYMIHTSKEKQQYDVKKYEIVFLVISLAITIVMGIYRFGKNMNMYFETTDPAAHYLLADRFADSNLLLEKSPEDLYYGKPTNSLFMSYTTLGTLFQLSNNDFVVKYTIFIGFELAVVFLSVLMLLYCVNNFVKKWNAKKIIFSAILSILFAFGYVFNNLIFGFHYLGLSVMLISILMLLTEYTFKDKITIENLIVLGLFAFSIFTTYYLFVPIVYGAIGLYILYQWKFLKKITFKQAVKYICISLVIPFIIGMSYYFVSNLFVKSAETSPVSTFKLEGYIYRNLISNFMLILLIDICGFFYDIKHKKINIYDLGLLMNILFILILFPLLYEGKIASYYFYKLYYPLWTIAFLSFGKILVTDVAELKTFSISILCLLFMLFIAECTNIDNKMFTRNPLLNNTTFVDSIENIYWFNNYKTDKTVNAPIFTQKELKDLSLIFKKYKSNLATNGYYFVEDTLKKLWIYSFTRISPINGGKKLKEFYNENPSIESLIDNNVKYIIYSKNNENVYTSDKFTKLYENDSYILSENISN